MRGSSLIGYSWTYLRTFSVLAILDSIPCHWDLSGNGDVDLVSGQGHTNMVCSIIATPDKLYSLGLDKSFRTIQAATNEFWLVLGNFQRRVEASTIMVKRLTKWIIGGIQPCSQAFAVSIPRLPAWEWGCIDWHGNRNNKLVLCRKCTHKYCIHWLLCTLITCNKSA